jgi:small GTP-binding protein
MDEYVIKILTLGDTGVGKTSIIQKFVNDKFSQNMLSTIGVDFQSKIIMIDNTKVKLKIWDTTGQERFKTLTSQYYNGADGALLIFDVTNKESFERINFWMNELNEKKKLNELGLLLIGNKIDLVNKRIIDKEEAENFAKNNNLSYYETSALKNININNIIIDIAKQCLNNIKRNDENIINNSINEKKMIIENIGGNKKKKCC